MDIIEYVEKVLDVKLHCWQKEYLRVLDKARVEGKVLIMNRKGYPMFIYPDQNSIKELTKNGTTLNNSI